MVYEAGSVKSSVSIQTKNYKPAFEKICDAFPYIISCEARYRQSFSMALEELGFCFDANPTEDGAVSTGEMRFEYSDWREDEQAYLLHIIAPYVEKGSYITFSDSYGDHWMVYFDGEKEVHFPGVVTFPGCPVDVQVGTT